MPFFPGGVSEESLASAVKNEQALRAALKDGAAARRELYRLTYLNAYQLKLALVQADEELRSLAQLLKHAVQKLEWERTSRWRKLK